MNQVGQKRVLNNIVSPYGLALFSYAVFLFACLIPPAIYTYYMREPDLMFIDPATILFYTLCVAAFLGGSGSLSNFFHRIVLSNARSTPGSIPQPSYSFHWRWAWLCRRFPPSSS